MGLNELMGDGLRAWWGGGANRKAAQSLDESGAKTIQTTDASAISAEVLAAAAKRAKMQNEFAQGAPWHSPEGVSNTMTAGDVKAGVRRLPSSHGDRPGGVPASDVQASKAYLAANQRLVGKYPTLDRVLKDPDAFISDIKGRFAAQKKLTPNDPYRFDFSDYGMPVLKQWAPMLDAELAEVRGKLAEFPAGSKKAVEAGQTIAHLQDLKGQLGTQIASGRVDYKSFQQISYFISRGMGRFDARALSTKERLLLQSDRYLQGHKIPSITEERALYKSGRMTIFNGKSPVSGFKDAHHPFENAFGNKNELKMIMLPTSEPLGNEVFMRLSDYDLFLTGVTREPIGADGFVRPSSDFWVHDARHNSAMFEKREEYEAKNKLNPVQAGKLAKQIDVWRQELDAETAKIQDPALRSAVKFFEFNYHHDRGFMMVPSSFKSNKAPGAYIPYLLYRTLTFADQMGQAGAHLDAPRKTLKQAYDFLHVFWAQRAPQEQAILSSKT